MAAAISVASSLGLSVDDAVVLQDSNRLTLRLLPCDVVARVALAAQQVAQLEIDLAQRLTEAGSPVATLDPRAPPAVHEHAGFVMTFWTYYESTASGATPVDHATALERLHVGLRSFDLPAPHFLDRVDSAQRLVASRDRTPALADKDRQLLSETLRRLGSRADGPICAEQLLHGEPHPGNVLSTSGGLVFIDLETCCRGPIEFDLAHAPVEVAAHYPGLDHELLRDCRLLVLAMITAWRWDRDDQLPNGRQLGTEWLSQLRAADPARRR